jgi:RHS repeat-associated protein
MTDGGENVVWDAVYNPFGGVNSITGSATNNLRFPGQYFLIEDGLHYNWYRHYDPTLGRYIQPDPLGFVNGPTLYAYAKSAPLTEVDPDGLQVAIPVPGPPFTPVPPGAFDEWRKHAEAGIGGLLNFCRRMIGSGDGGGDDKDQCHERYEEEAQRCRDAAWQVAHPDYTEHV